MPRDPSEIIIEMGGPKNEDVVFDPLLKTLRGTYRTSELPLGSRSSNNPLTMRIKDVPGMRICINPGTCRGRVVDPLSFPSNAQLMADINAAGAKEAITRQWSPVPDATYELTPDQTATWLYHMKLLVDRGHATLRQGNLDTAVEKASGRVMVDCYLTIRGEPKFLDEFEARDRGEWPRQKEPA